MRVHKTTGAVRGLAIAGTRFVGLGWDMSASDIKSQRVLGFAIERTRKRDRELIYLRGMKTFKSILADPGKGVKVTSRDHPFQAFQWSEGWTFGDIRGQDRTRRRRQTLDLLQPGRRRITGLR
jgi:hypothetical protein